LVGALVAVGSFLFFGDTLVLRKNQENI